MSRVNLAKLKAEDPVAAKWAKKILELSGNRIETCQWSLVETGARIAAEFERSSQSMQIQVEQIRAKVQR